ncbi:integral membrane protein GPR180-like [Elysia marginata]|uniref:Integral membrane protein GPR180-like n=1 Tax=Elysia marginata TaxID=1093978 RepID=A0AAV4IPT0_9GAST|nr:integral membrane protein GPR180-like [Elysia marginata]
MAAPFCMFLLIVCTFGSTSYGLHLSGSWNSKDFYVFLAKFGFQKTDPKELEKTQGFIFGNVTTRDRHDNRTNLMTLVVVDSEYFLEFYGNSTLPAQHACPVMFNKLDTIAFDYICKPNGMEDFLRKVPCPRNSFCADEDDPHNVVSGFQFTYKVRDVQRPRFWYLSFVACGRDTSKRKCEWQSYKDLDITIDYDIWLVNGDPSLKGLNPFEHHFSFEFHNVFEIHLIAAILCIAIFLLWLYAFSSQRHLTTRLFTVCLCGEIFSIFLTLTHVCIYAVNGVGAEWLNHLGKLLDLATECLFVLLLLLLAKGLGITTDQFKWKSLIVSLWAAYTLLNVFLYIWNLVEIESVISNTPEWQSWPGYAMLAFRLIVMVWFLLQLRQTYGNTDREDLSFVMHFGAFSLVWFSYLPALALITTQVSPLWRYKTILTFRRLVPRPSSPSPLQFSAGSCLAQPSLPFVTSVVLCYSVPLPPPPTHTHIMSCAASITGPTLVQPQSFQLATGPTPLPHTAEAHTQTHPNKCKQAS